MKMNESKVRVLMVVGFYITIILLIVVVMILVKNVNEIKTDPIVYGVDKKGFEMCSCYDSEGNNYNYNSTGMIPKTQGGWNIKLIEP